MNLPRELVDKIMRYNNLQALKACSLTSRAFYSAARPLVHGRMVLGLWSAIRGSSPDIPFSLEAYDQQPDIFHARYLSAAEGRGLLRYGYVREVDLDLFKIAHPETVLQLQQLRALETVQALSIDSLVLGKVLPIFDRCFSQFVPTLRSLRLQAARCENPRQLMEFICRFPYLDDLALDCLNLDGSPSTDAPLGSEGPRLQQHLSLRDDLVLGATTTIAQSLSNIPGGIHFRSIEVESGQKGLPELLVACSSTLEVLTIRCFQSSKSTTCVPAHRFTERSPISSSPVPKASGSLPDPKSQHDQPRTQRNSQAIRASGGPWRTRHPSFFYPQDSHVDFVAPLFGICPPIVPGIRQQRKFGGRRTLWGTGWEVVDEDLCAHAARRDDFRFMIEIVPWESTIAAVEALFPRMKSKGSLFVTWQPRKRWGLSR